MRLSLISKHRDCDRDGDCQSDAQKCLWVFMNILSRTVNTIISDMNS